IVFKRRNNLASGPVCQIPVRDMKDGKGDKNGSGWPGRRHLNFKSHAFLYSKMDLFHFGNKFQVLSGQADFTRSVRNKEAFHSAGASRTRSRDKMAVIMGAFFGSVLAMQNKRVWLSSALP